MGWIDKWKKFSLPVKGGIIGIIIYLILFIIAVKLYLDCRAPECWVYLILVILPWSYTSFLYIGDSFAVEIILGCILNILLFFVIGFGIGKIIEKSQSKINKNNQI